MENRKLDIWLLVIAVLFTIGIVTAALIDNTNIQLFVILGFFGVALAISIFINPSIGIFVLIGAVFTNISAILTDNGYPGITQPLVMLVFLGTVAHHLYNGRQQTRNRDSSRIEMFLLVYSAIVIFSFVFATNKDAAVESIMDLVKDVIIVYCVIFAIRKPKDLNQAIWMIILTVAGICVLEVYQIVFSDYSNEFFGLANVEMDKVFDSGYEARLGGPINAPNLWGQVLVAVTPLIAYRIIDEPRIIVKVISGIILGLVFLVILNTYSRGAYLALILVFALIFFERKLNPIIVLTSMGAFIIMLMFSPSEYIERFTSLQSLIPSSTSNIYDDASLRGRTSENLAAIHMFLDYPIFGIGAGNYESNYLDYAEEIGIETRNEERQAHSLYLQIVSETGALGLLTFAGFVITLFIELEKIRKARKKIKKDSWRLLIISLQLSVLSYLFTSIFLHGAYFRFFWIFAALTIAGIRLTTKHNINPNFSLTSEVKIEPNRPTN